MPGTLQGRTVIVTGAAGGIGRAISSRLSAGGAHLVVTDRHDDALAQVVAGLPSPAVPVAVDLTDPDAGAALVSAAQREFGTVDVLVNNAAYNVPSDALVLDADEEVWHQTFAVNLYAPLRLTKAVLPTMLAQGDGAIVNISSGAGLMGDLSRAGYGASKAALNSLTRYTATQYGKQGIRANAIAPGLLLHEALDAVVPPAIVDAIQGSVLAPRAGRATDLAGIVAFLAGTEAAFINGQILQVDAGMTAHGPQFDALLRLGA